MSFIYHCIEVATAFRCSSDAVLTIRSTLLSILCLHDITVDAHSFLFFLNRVF
ncbi:hypothetical protein ACE6H2_026139 [Prunus campanulata]